MKPALIRLTPLAIFAAFALSGCSGGGGAGGVQGTSGDFLVLSTEPQSNGQLFLNEPIRIDFSNPVDLSSADLNTVSFTVFDQNGMPLSEQPVGTFQLDRSPGDEQVGRRLLFIPRLPSNNSFDNGGFRPGRRYVVSLVGGSRRNRTVLRDVRGQALAVPVSFQFTTADGSTPAQLFRDTRLGGPRLLNQPEGFRINPETGLQNVTLNKFGDVGVEIRLAFDQPLNPHSDNVPVQLDTNPVVRSRNDRGRIFLEYDDPERGLNTWIPADVFLEVNTLSRSVVLLRPVGVLPNNAEVRVIALDTLEDISGESNVANAAYNPVVGVFRTESGYEPQFDAIVENFDDDRQIDFAAPFLEPVADFSTGMIKADFSFQGTPTILDYEPRTREVVLNTNFTQITPATGQPFNVSGGVFNFRDVRINQGVSVVGQGTNPMIWLVSGDFIVAGELSVRGGDGDRVNVLNSANFPAAGGVGVCGGGNGGQGSPNSTVRSFTGETGFGPGQEPGGGGRGGMLDCTRCGIGSGGGGGSLATQGDPWYKQQAGTGTSFQQQRGVGGQGCSGASGSATRTLDGGEAGPLAFVDARADNNFWGSGVDVNRQIRIVGELVNPIGGAGGGGGGDRSTNCNPNDLNFAQDDKGGGGGGGGGVLIVQALGRIVIEASGRINADGGHGGGGEQAGSCDQGGGGGAGSGGMVILMAGQSIDINVKGDAAANRFTYADNDYDFSVSADGGVCRTGTFGSPVVADKYPRSGATVMPGNQYDARPLGALGGMGVVQLMAPSGNNADNTNTVLDDGINVFRTGQPLSGMEKQDMLAWRGFPDASGQFVDDFGNPTNIGNDEGDIRPAPILLPVPFAERSRLRSKWIDTGASVRRPLTAPDGAPRGIVVDPVNNLIEGPQYSFAATQNTPSSVNTHGFVEFEQATNSVRIDYPAVLPSPVQILRRDASASFQGEPAYRIELTSAALGSIVNRYVQYEAEFLDAQGTVQGSFRILEHSDRVLLLSTESGPLPGAAQADRLQVRAKFFKIVTGGAEGLGPTYIGAGSTRLPVANVRIGFAFHKDATQAQSQGMDPDRLPQQVGTYLFDLTDPNRIEEVRNFGAAFVQWDILFDLTYQRDANDPVPSLSPSSPRPEVHFLRIPMRF